MVSSHERRTIPDAGLDGPDIGFKTAIGFYLGLVVAGITTIGGIAVGASTAALLATAPSTITAMLLLGLIFGDRLRGIPERIGASRRRRLACYVPPAVFAAMLFAPTFVAIDASGRFVAVTIASILLTGAMGFGITRMARKRYVEAITDDEPAARWTWHRTGYQSGEVVAIAMMSLTIVAGVALAWTGSWFGLLWTVYGVVMLLSRRFDWGESWNDFDPSDRWNPPEIRAHTAGLAVGDHKLVSWDAIGDVRLTDGELVLERSRWVDIRCDRSVIDDPEGVLESIERTRERAERAVANRHR